MSKPTSAMQAAIDGADEFDRVTGRSRTLEALVLHGYADHLYRAGGTAVLTAAGRAARTPAAAQQPDADARYTD